MAEQTPFPAMDEVSFQFTNKV
uniref:Uncharacterized protein n=1 Tax=Arundo donax TaxID=35708 RepID=A0A0A9AD67_ARUDO